MPVNDYRKRERWLRGVAYYSDSAEVADLLHGYADDLARKVRFIDLRNSMNVSTDTAAAATRRGFDELC